MAGLQSTPVPQASRSRERVKTASFEPVGDLLNQVLSERYRLDSILGTGGMGTVYRATHVTIGKQLAVKVLAQEFANEETFRVRFLREAQAISQIGHENVVEVTDFGVTPTGSLYLAMELLEGEVLSDLLDRDGALGWARSKPIVLQVCRALQAAHDKGILHRDIKPENCFCIVRGESSDFVKVLDFGLAKMFMTEAGLETSLSAVGGILGTPEYMSPERIRGEQLDVRSDLYAVGVLAYELVTGCVPFSGDHYTLVLDQQLHAEPVPPSEVAPRAGIGPQLEAAILKALAKDREQRFDSVGALAEALSAADAAATGSAAASEGSAASAAIGPVPPASRERTYQAVIVVLGLMVLALGGLTAALALDWL